MLDKSRIMKNSQLAYVLCFLLFAYATNAQTNTNLSVSTFEAGMKKTGIQLLDVRTIAEFNDGHLKDALQADWNNTAEFVERVKALDKSKPVYTYCLSGARSNTATKWLNENGYTAYNMKGGIAAWKTAGKEVNGAKAVAQMTLQEFMARLPTGKTVLVDVGASWCPPCKKMNPIIDSLAKANANKISLVKIDGGEQIKLAADLKVNAFPTFIIYKKGKEVWRKQGLVDAKEIAARL